MKIHKFCHRSARFIMGKGKKFQKRTYNLTRQALDVLVRVYNHMIRRLAITSVWIVATPLLLLSLAVSLTFQKNDVSLPKVTSSLDVTSTVQPNVIEAQVISQEITDPRPFIVEKFLKGTPLEPYSGYIVETSDKYGIDYRLIPAIAMKESGGGAAVDPASHNAWGFENGKTYFPSWEYAIDRVGSTLKNGYISKGLTTPEQIMAKYAPPQLETGGKWAKDINHFYSQMETL